MSTPSLGLTSYRSNSKGLRAFSAEFFCSICYPSHPRVTPTATPRAFRFPQGLFLNHLTTYLSNDLLFGPRSPRATATPHPRGKAAFSRTWKKKKVRRSRTQHTAHSPPTPPGRPGAPLPPQQPPEVVPKCFTARTRRSAPRPRLSAPRGARQTAEGSHGPRGGGSGAREPTGHPCTGITFLLIII